MNRMKLTVRKCLAACLLLLAMLVFSTAFSSTNAAAATTTTTRRNGASGITSYNGVSYSRVYNFYYYTTYNWQARRYAKDPKGAIKHFVTYGIWHQL